MKYTWNTLLPRKRVEYIWNTPDIWNTLGMHFGNTLPNMLSNISFRGTALEIHLDSATAVRTPVELLC